ncbi:MAG: DUF3108 domain-containing protein [Methylotenera sp.]
MLKLTQFIIFLFLLTVKVALAQPAFAQPKSILLEYEVTRDGKPFANVRETFVNDGKLYRIESITKGIGIYALFGERKLTSKGEVTNDGLKPSHFELHQGDNAKKSLITDFDWVNNTLNMQVKGKIKTAILEKGTQDLVSYAYQFMFSLAQKNESKPDEVKVSLTTGKKLNQYQYKIIERGLMLEARNASYKTLHLSSAEGPDKKQLWLAEEQFYLPVRYMLTDENGATLTQTLTKIHVE